MDVQSGETEEKEVMDEEIGDSATADLAHFINVDCKICAK